MDLMSAALATIIAHYGPWLAKLRDAPAAIKGVAEATTALRKLFEREVSPTPAQEESIPKLTAISSAEDLVKALVGATGVGGGVAYANATGGRGGDAKALFGGAIGGAGGAAQANATVEGKPEGK